MNQSVLVKRVRVSDLVLKVLIYFAAAISILLLVGIMCYTFYRGFSSISLEFLTTVPSTLNGTFGIAGNLLNTLYIVLITLLIATPIGVGSAIYLNEYAKPGRLVRLIEFTTETLSGIPSIFEYIGEKGELPASGQSLELLDSKILENGVVWLHYKFHKIRH